MAALEAKIQQYERNVDHLKKALERSDQYIEDLESQLRKPENRCHEVQDMHGSNVAPVDSLTQQQKISMMMRSLSDSERGSICSNPEAEYQNFGQNPRFMCMPPANGKEFQKTHSEGQNEKNFEGASPDFLPTTPSSAFRSLSLRSPGIREKKVAFKPVSHLRRLNFEEFPSPEKSGGTIGEKPFSSLDKLPKCLPSKTDMEPSKSVLWDGWQRSESTEPGPSSESTVQGAASASLEGDNSDSFQMSSEASMDAAYLDKISELDSMLDGESSSSRGSQLSLVSSPPADLDNTIVPEPQSSPDILSSHLQHDHGDDHVTLKEAIEASSEERFTTLGSDSAGGATVPDSTSHRGSSQTDELSFNLLFDSLEESKIGPGGSLSKGSQNDPCVNSSTSSSCVDKPTNTAKDRQALNISQPTKRKSHSPFNTSSPTKLSKLM